MLSRNLEITDHCGYCGGVHSKVICPRIKMIEYYPDGRVKMVEFYDNFREPDSIHKRSKSGECK